MTILAPGPNTLAANSSPVDAALTKSRPMFVAAFEFSAAMSVLALTTSFYMLQVYDRVLTSRSVDTLILLTVIAVVGISVFGVLDSLRVRLLNRIGLRVADALAPQVLRAMITTTSRSGGHAYRAGLRDVETLRNFIGSHSAAAMMDAPFIVVYLIVLWLINPIFLVIVLAGSAVLVALAVANQRATDPPLAQSLARSAHNYEFAEDGLRNSDVLEGMGMSSAFVERWRRQWVETVRFGTLASDRDSRLSSLSRGVRLLIQIVLLGAGALLILDYRATGGIMIGASIIGARALAPIESLVATWKTVIAARLARARLNNFLQNAVKSDEGMELPAPTGDIRVSGVHYLVPSTRKPVLANIQFELPPGESLGVVGPSASGKSTLLRLMTGAWPCTSGSVRLDGADIHAWPRGKLSHYIGYLPQDVELFSGTIRENIARMAEGDPQMVVQAAKIAGAHEMILALPNGYDTQIGTNGHNLSGGQSQRIGIARALYGEPRLVVLDEPNSNLDSAGEEALLVTLSALKANGTTVVVVAHRPSILQNVDKMLALRANGTMDIFGSRADVMQNFAKRAAARGATNIVPLSSGGTNA